MNHRASSKLARTTRSSVRRQRITPRMQFALQARAAALAIGASAVLFGHSVQGAADVVHTVTGTNTTTAGYIDLSNGANYTTSITPTAAAADDIDFAAATNFTANSTFDANGAALSFGSLDDQNATALTITNSSATAATLSLSLNSGANTNATTGSNGADLLYVATGANLSLTNGSAGGLTLLLANTGNIDAAGTGVINIGTGVTITALKVISFTGTGTTTVSGNIGNTTGAVTINDSTGTTIFSGTNTYSGATTLTGGTLRLVGAGALSTNSALTFASGSTLQLRGDANTTFSAASLANTPGGSITIDVNQATSGHTGNTLTLSNAFTVNATSTINVTGGNGYTLGLGTITGAGNSSDAVFNVASGVGLSLSLAGATGGNDGFSFTGAGNTTIVAANLANSNSRSMTLNLNDTGTVTLSGASFTTTGSSGSGNIVLNSGALVLGNTGALGTKFGNLTITGGSLDASVAITTAASNPSQNWNGSFTFTGSNSLNLGTGAVTVGANSTLTASASTLTVGAITDVGSVTFTKAGAGTLSTPGLVLGAGTSGFSSTNGALTSTGQLSVPAAADGTVNATSGTVTFTTINRTTGGAVDFTGTLANISTTAVNTGAGILGGWATVNGNSDYAMVSGGKIAVYTGQTALTAAGGGTQTTTNFSLATGLTLTSAVTSNSLKVSDTGTTDVLANGGNNITFNSQSGGLLYASGTTGSAYTISGAGVVGGGTTSEFIVDTQQGTLTISSPVVSTTATAGSLTKTGAGTLVLQSNASAYTGASNLDAGTVQIGAAQGSGAAGPLGSGSNALNMGSGATLDLEGYNVSVGTLTTAGTAGTNSILTSSNGAATLTIAGGSNLSTLTVNNAASILVNGGSSLTTGTTLITGTGSLGFQNQTAVLRDNNIVGNLGTSGSLLFNGSGLFQTTSAVALAAGNSVIVNGTGNQWNYQATTTIPGAFTGSGTLTFSNGFNPTVSLTGNLSAFTGTLGLLGSGSGQAFQFSNTTTFGNSTNWTLNTNGPTTAANAISYYAYTGTGNKTVILGSLSGAVAAGTGTGAGFTGYGVLTNNTAATTATWQIGGANATTTFAGVIQNGTGTSALTEVGTGNFTLSGVNTFTGATSVTGTGTGTLTLAATKTLGSTSGITVSSGTLALTAASALNTPGATTSTTAGSPVSVAGQVPISLGGGALQRNGTGVSLGSQSGTSGTVGIGMLTLTTASTLDYGTTGVGTLNFNGFSDAGGSLLTVLNYTSTYSSTATPGAGTDGTDDRLIFNQMLTTAQLADFSINGQTPTQLALGNGEYELVTAVPEPSTWTAGLLCLGAVGFRLRRRLGSLFAGGRIA